MVGLSIFMYIRVDPLKSCLRLIGFLIFYLFFLSLGKNIWYSYFICLIFVRGILAILVYFTSLSSLNIKNFNLNLGILIVLIFFFRFVFYFFFKDLNLRRIFLNFYCFLFLWILSVLLIFFNFLRYLVSFLKGLRKF